MNKLLGTSSIATTFLDSLIDDTALKDYYTDNEPAHKLVNVKDFLLAEGIPAITLPMGANENGKLIFNQVSNNINMSATCKTNEDDWPNKRDGDWYHSDYKEMPFQQVYKFYKEINNLTK